MTRIQTTHDLEALTDKYVLASLCTWLVGYSNLALSIELTLSFFFGLLAILIVIGFYWRVKDSADFAKPLLTELDIQVPGNIRFVKLGNADFSERSNLICRLIAIPAPVSEQNLRDMPFLAERITHELAHAHYRDCLMVTLYLALSVFTVLASIHVAIAVVGTGTMSTNVASMGFLLFVICIFTLTRLIMFLKSREFRADALVYEMLGVRYENFITYRARVEELDEDATFLHSIWNRLTHPTFKARLNSIHKRSLSLKAVFLNGVFLYLLLIFSLGFTLIHVYNSLEYFAGGAAAALFLFRGSTSEFYQFAAQLLMISMWLLALHFLLYSISKFQFIALSKNLYSPAPLFHYLGFVIGHSVLLLCFIILSGSGTERVFLQSQIFWTLAWFFLQYAFNWTCARVSVLGKFVAVSRVTFAWGTLFVMYHLTLSEIMHIFWIHSIPSRHVALSAIVIFVISILIDFRSYLPGWKYIDAVRKAFNSAA